MSERVRLRPPKLHATALICVRPRTFFARFEQLSATQIMSQPVGRRCP